MSATNTGEKSCTCWGFNKTLGREDCPVHGTAALRKPATSCDATSTPTPRSIAKRLRAGGMVCNCDLDNWQPEPITGHSHVCRIHKAAMQEYRRG
jgi:hypothetical protein